MAFDTAALDGVTIGQGITLLSGDCRTVLPTLAANSVQCVVTSPPYYGLRDYGTAQWDGGDAGCDHAPSGTDRGVRAELPNPPAGWAGRAQGYPNGRCCTRCGARRIDAQIGLEATPDEYIAQMVAVFREVRRVLRDDGTCWINLGDSYNANQGSGFNGNAGKATASPRMVTGLAPKQLMMMPARVALALQADGWWLRSAIVWAKPNPMPESVTDRPTSAYEMVYLLTKRSRYYYDSDAIRERVGEETRRNTEFRGESTPYKNNQSFNNSQQIKNYAPAGEPALAGRNSRNVWEIATSPFSEWTPSHEIIPLPTSEGQERAASRNAGAHDTARITSPDCPLHGAHPDSVPTGFYDGLSDDQVSRIRGTGDCRAPGTHPDSATTQRIPERSSSPLSTSGCSALEDAASATPHSTESHRTDRAPSSFERAISSVETACDTLRIAPSPCSPASTDHDTAGSSSEVGSSLLRCEPQTADDSSHTSGSDGSCACRCGYYRKVSTKTGHFATFPPELAERCIKAGTSERGCCAACGAPWVRQTERAFKPTQDPISLKAGDKGIALGGWDTPRGVNDTTTTGWRASCKCDAPTQPCTILDPFAGAGTALLVADRLQRNAIGIELNVNYTRMAMDRVRADAPLFSSWPPAEDPADQRMAADAIQRDLFGC